MYAYLYTPPPGWLCNDYLLASVNATGPVEHRCFYGNASAIATYTNESSRSISTKLGSETHIINGTLVSISDPDGGAIILAIVLPVALLVVYGCLVWRYYFRGKPSMQTQNIEMAAFI